MALTEHYFTRFEEGNFYHVFNRTVDRKPMFKSDGNYKFFLKKYSKYLSHVVDTYAFCLLGNHFHLLVRVKEHLAADINLNIGIPGKTAHDIVSHQFRKFFQSYAMALNIQHSRIGTLFQTPFKRALIDKDQYLAQLLYFIHTNPQQHGLIHDFKDWKWSSYERILNDKPSKLKKWEVIEWFGNKEQYKQYHKNLKQVSGKYILEDE